MLNALQAAIDLQKYIQLGISSGTNYLLVQQGKCALLTRRNELSTHLRVLDSILSDFLFTISV